MRATQNGHGAALDLLLGGLAGAAAVWTMDRVDWFNYQHEGTESRAQTAAARPGGLDPAHVIANRAAGAMGVELSPRQPHPAGIGVHYALGVVPGALYGVLQDRVPWLGAGRGPLFGLGLFLVEDELANPLLGAAAPPGRYPPQAHLRGLVAHLVHGLALDGTLRALRAAAGRR